MTLRICFIVFISMYSLHAQEKRIEVLPNPDVIYKLNGDIGFEDLNFGLRIFGVETPEEIKSLTFIYSRDTTEVMRRHIKADGLSGFQKPAPGDALLYHNFQEYIPAAVNICLLEIRIAFRNGDVISKRVPLQYFEQQNSYWLPLKGVWFVSSGHDFGVEHRRHLSRGHFAYDFVKVDSNGRQTVGDSLQDNFSFGEVIVAPAYGVVIAAMDEEMDNPPGQVKSRKANYIEIDHGNNEVSRMVHLKQGSLLVAIGDTVKVGQPVARVGNSGFSETPHLHIGFQKNELSLDGKTRSFPLPVEFNNYRVSWNQGQDQLIIRGRPRRGQFVVTQAVGSRGRPVCRPGTDKKYD